LTLLSKTEFNPNSSPSQFTNLQLWFDASTIAQSDNTAVSSWTDLSTNAWSFSQVSTTQQPTFRTNRQNRLPAVVFDGVDDFLASTAAVGIMNNVPGCIMFLVAKWNPTATGGRPFTIGASTSNTNRFNFSKGSDNLPTITGRRIDGEATISADTNTFAVDGNQFFICSGLIDYINGFIKIYYNGLPYSQYTLTTFGGNSSATNSFAVRMGANAAASAGQPFSGEICELIVYNRALSEDEISRIHAYLAAKWGINII